MNSKLCIFGEVLFDHFPDGKSVLGGAPFNVAWHLQSFGLAPLFVSQVGDDIEGRNIRQAMTQWQMDTSAVNIDANLPTGKVEVQITDDEPEYNIVSPSAWDAININDQNSMSCEFLYHGSLALRHEPNRSLLDKLLQNKPHDVFLDINLRVPWWNRNEIKSMIARSDWLKLNIDELNLIYPSSQSSLTRMQALIQQHGLKGVILTQGSAGAELMTEDGSLHEVAPVGEVEIIDTVGAGDAFTSVIITGLLKKWPVAITLQRAQLFASAIVGQRGATVSNREFYQSFVQQWSL